MTGCLKKSDNPKRNLASKYFMPRLFIPDRVLPAYFSGAGYIMSASAVKKLLAVRRECDVIHLDDVYIGLLIKHAKLESEMMQSVSICTGITLEYGGVLPDAPTNPCLLSGLTMFHKFATGDEMIRSFNLLQNTNITDTCKPTDIEKIKKRWPKTTERTKFVASEWQELFEFYRRHPV